MNRNPRMYFREIIQDNKGEPKQFKTATGSPIVYKRYKKHRGIYYPLAKLPTNMKGKRKHNAKHICVVYSKRYGRELYANVDIWPDDEKDQEKLLRKLESMSLEDDTDDDDFGIDIPKGVEDVSENANSINETNQSKENGSHPQSSKDTSRHVTITVTDTTEEHSPLSGDKQIHPAPSSPTSQSSEEGQWPLKRSQSVSSRDNPFLPGGDLRKEADELLSKATIIRDTFILNEKNNARKGEQQSSAKPQPETKSNESNCVSQTPVSESMIQNQVVKSECAVVQNASPTKTLAKENGQVETENSVSSGNVGIEIADDNKAKKKSRNCCAIM